MRRSSTTRRPAQPWAVARAAGFAAALVTFAWPASSQVILDGSIRENAPVGLVDSDMGFTYWITEDLGAIVGDGSQANLFHSFSQFDIREGEKASFVNANYAGIIRNIIARVTNAGRPFPANSAPSMINGLIQSQIAGASLFLLNPAGIMFGPRSELNLAGSGYFSTAPVLRFPEGGDFDFETGQAIEPVTLSAADPTAFGFRAAEPGVGEPTGVKLQLSTGFGKDGEFLGPGGTLGFVAESVTLEAFTGVSQTIATGETVAMAAVGNAAVDVPVDIPSFDVSGFEPGELGPIRIADNAFVILSNRGSDDFSTGRLVVRGGSFVLGSQAANDATQILAQSGTGAPPRDTPVVDVAVAGDADPATPDLLVEGASGGRPRISVRQINDPVAGVSLVGPSVAVRGAASVLPEIEIWNLSNEDASSLVLDIHADEIRIEDGGQLRSAAIGNPASTGAGGRIHLDANEIHVDGGGLVHSLTRNAGTGGPIDIDAGNLTVDDGLIGSEHLAAGRGGAIDIDASGSVEVRGFGGIISGADVFPAPAVADAPGGDIRIAADTIRVTSESTAEDFTASQISAIANTSDEAAAGGDVFLTARQVLLENGGFVGVSTEGASDSGRIQISGPVARGQEVSDLMPAELVLIDGIAQVGPEPDSAGLFARARSDGDAGSIEVASRIVEVRAGGSISAEASESTGAGNAGSIRIEQADRLTVTSESASGFAPNPSSIAVNARDGTETGDVVIESDLVELLSGGAVTADTSGSAPAGSILIDAREAVFDGFFVQDPAILSSGLFSQAIAGGGSRAGDITLRIGESLTVSNQAAISVEALGGSFAGDITIEGSNADVLLTGGAEVTGLIGKSPGVPGPGEDPTADVVIATVNSLTMNDGALISVETDNSGQGGIASIHTRRGVSLANGARISSLSRLDSVDSGDAGDIQIAALSLSVDSGSEITAETKGAGDAGLIDIDVLGRAVLSSGGRIFSSSFGDGAAGSVDFRAATLLIDGGGLPADAASAIAAETNAAGAGGNVSVITTDSTTLERGGRISSSSLSEQSDAGIPGNVLVDGGRQLVLRGGSAITTDARQALKPSGGKITLRATELIYLEDSEVSTSVFQGAGGGGDIGIPNLPVPEGAPAGEGEPDAAPDAAPPELLVLNRSTIKANAEEGRGGNILIAAGTIFRSAESVIEAKSNRGIDGNVDISAPDSDLAGQVTPLTSRFFDASELMLPACAARTSRAGSFTIQTRAVQPPPDAPLPASLAISADPTRGAACST